MESRARQPVLKNNMRTPLAWKNLTSSLGKFLLSATGVGFAVLLMFMQLGFRKALFDSNVAMIRLFEADLVMISPARFNLSSERRFDLHWLQKAAATEGVESVSALRTERNMANVKVEGYKARRIRVLAIDPDTNFFADDDLANKLSEADRQRGILLDRRSKSVYGFAKDRPVELAEQHVELNGTAIRIHDTFSLGTDFANDGTLLMSNRLYPNLFPYRSPTRDAMDLVDFGLIRVKPNANWELIRDELSKLNPEEIVVYKHSDYVDREINFWSKQTPIGVIFGVGTLMGLVVGAIICYQIQFTDISENMPELATLKAMGYSNLYFWSLVLCQSLYLACIGFIPGLLSTLALNELLGWFSGLVMQLDQWGIVQVWALTLGMCMVSGVLALRRLWRADPASLF